VSGIVIIGYFPTISYGGFNTGQAELVLGQAMARPSHANDNVGRAFSNVEK